MSRWRRLLSLTDIDRAYDKAGETRPRWSSLTVRAPLGPRNSSNTNNDLATAERIMVFYVLGVVANKRSLLGRLVCLTNSRLAFKMAEVAFSKFQSNKWNSGCVKISIYSPIGINFFVTTVDSRMGTWWSSYTAEGLSWVLEW